MTARVSLILGKPRGHRPRLQTLLGQALYCCLKLRDFRGRDLSFGALMHPRMRSFSTDLHHNLIPQLLPADKNLNGLVRSPISFFQAVIIHLNGKVVLVIFRIGFNSASGMSATRLNGCLEFFRTSNSK